MADPAEWSSRADVETPGLLSFDINSDTREDSADSSKQNVRDIAALSLGWAGVTEATARWHCMMYRRSTIAVATAAASGVSVGFVEVPTASASTMRISGFANADAELHQGWRFMVWPDETIYTLTADSVFRANYADVVGTSGTPQGMAIDLVNTPNKLYYTTGTAIRRCNLDGTGDESLVTGLSAPFGICLDESNDKMYWTDAVDFTIEYADLDGSNSGTLVTNTGGCYGIDLDSSYVYWGEASKLRRCDKATGANVTDLISAGITTPQEIVCDAGNSYLYFSEPNTSQIYRSSLTGTGLTTLISASNSFGIALDTTNEYLYYTQAGTNRTVMRHALDGTGSSTELFTLTTGEATCLDVDVSGATLYILNKSGNKIHSGHTAGFGANISVSPAVTAGTVALGVDAPIYFFLPVSNGATRTAPDGSLYTIAQELEFKTPYVDVEQPEEA